jgi:hypothetical protein
MVRGQELSSVLRTVGESSAAPSLGQVGDSGGKLARLFSLMSEVGAIHGVG